MNKNFRTPASYDKGYGIDLFGYQARKDDAGIPDNVGTYAEARFIWYQAEKAYKKALEEDRKARTAQRAAEDENNRIRAEWFAIHPRPSAKQLESLKKLLKPIPERGKIKLPRKPMMRYYQPGKAPVPTTASANK